MMLFINELFSSIFVMSVNSSIVALLIIVVRLALIKSPRIFSLMLWFVVFFRLLCPITIQNEFGLPILLQNNINQTIGTWIPASILAEPIITQESENKTYLLPTNTAEPALITSSDLYSATFNVLSYVWFFGFIALFLYNFLSYILLKRKMRLATRMGENIYESDRIKTPFVLGLIRPAIYIPKGLEVDELEYILNHEQIHIKRYDNLLKPIALLAVTLHWFNPVVWISFILMSQDMELSADESVLKRSTIDIRKAYAASLIRLSTARGGLFFSLTFSKTSVESRVKNILNFKKPAFWVYAVSMIAVVGIGGFLLVNGEEKDIDGSLAWAHNLSVKDVQLIETVISPSDRDAQYKKMSSQELKSIVKIINSSEGEIVDSPDELGSTITLYITTKEGAVHTYQNLMNTYLVIDNVFFIADHDWLENCFKQFEGDGSIPDGFYERVTGVTTEYRLIKLDENGEALGEISDSEGADRKLAEDLVFNYMIKSTIYPAKDINAFEECYLLRVIYSTSNLNETHDYYLFSVNGDSYMQNGKDGFCAEINTELYNGIVNIINSTIAGKT